jgi:cardiolipin synthase
MTTCTRRTGTRTWLGGWLLLALAGCQAPPARVTTRDQHAGALCRHLILTGQVLNDSAVEAVYHPWRSGVTLLADPMDFLEATGGDFCCRHFACREGIGPARMGPCAAEDALPAAVQVYPDGGEALTALEQVIDSATTRIDVLMFAWDQGLVGQGVATRLAAKAHSQVRVRVLIDVGGNLVFGQPEDAPAGEVNKAVNWLADQPNVEVIRARNPFAHFDHRKLVLADGRLAWTGGRNLTSRGFFGTRDVSFTVAGPLANQLQERFDHFWQDQGGQPAESLAVAEPVCPNARGHVVETSPTDRSLKKALYRAVDEACHHVWLENPYLCDNRLVGKLVRAGEAGLDVRVVLTLHCDSPTLNRANRVTANRLLRAGAHVYLYPDLLHTKAATADGCWAYLGTGNFDPLSLRRNRELGVVLQGGPVLAEVEEKVFQTGFRPEWELHEPLALSATDYVCELIASCFL